MLIIRRFSKVTLCTTIPRWSGAHQPLREFDLHCYCAARVVREFTVPLNATAEQATNLDAANKGLLTQIRALKRMHDEMRTDVIEMLAQATLDQVAVVEFVQTVTEPLARANATCRYENGS